MAAPPSLLAWTPVACHADRGNLRTLSISCIMTTLRDSAVHGRRHKWQPAAVLVCAALAACEPPPGAGVESCSKRPGSLFNQRTSCTFTISPLDSNGYTVVHENADFGSRSAYTAAIEVEGSLRVKRGSVSMELVDDRGTTQHFRATTDSPVTFTARVATTMRGSVRGIRFALTPEGVPRSADSVALAFVYVK